MNPWDEISGANAGYVLELYERYQRDPGSVDEATRAAFRTFSPPPAASAPAAGAGAGATSDVNAAIAAVTLAESIRLRPAARSTHRLQPPVGDPSPIRSRTGSRPTLKALPAGIVGGPVARRAPAFEAIERLRGDLLRHERPRLRRCSCPTNACVAARVSRGRRFRPPADPSRARTARSHHAGRGVRALPAAHVPRQTRFSIRGLDLMIPLLDEIIADAAASGVKHVLIAMAHRGRLNVLAHVLRKPYPQILAEFKDPLFSRSSRIDLGWMGDVKYHAGARVEHPDRPQTLVISMPPNPSHLEAVDPLLVGMARAAGTSTSAPGAPVLKPHEVLGILIHGDSAFPGQGIVAETLNLSRLTGWNVGGTIHLIANNQLGFTADPHESFSTSYASGLARGFKIPIVHVSRRSVACIERARPWAYRQRFQLDFPSTSSATARRNEGDEPALPSRRLSRERHPVRQRCQALVASGDAATLPDELVAKHGAAMEAAYAGLKPEEHYIPEVPVVPPSGAAARVATAVPLDRLVALNDALSQVPAGFTVHTKLERGRDRKKAMLATPDEPTIDWSAAEELALASALADGIPVRFTGEDVERGTFSHRHAVLHDAVTGDKHVPLQTLPQAAAAFEIHNSALSALAVLGFELGYNLQEPKRLVLWEAQYGDFINGAQTILDEYLMSGRAKWGMAPSVVLLLPHGYEGQGPDHSSARVERFLQLAADTNVRIVNCTTAAQYFHVLRRQALLLETDPLPLIVLTPKSLLRHPMVASPARELAEGRFQKVIDDAVTAKTPAKVKRLVLCSGKVYVDLVSSEARKTSSSVAIARVEQLYPFPAEQVRGLFERYTKLKEVCWVQEEPENMGGWDFVRGELERLIDGRWPLRYVGRVLEPVGGSAAGIRSISGRSPAAFEATCPTPRASSPTGLGGGAGGH
jgi:2-oxoglutarate dehydrogenase E1 component